MATIAQTLLTGSGDRAVTETTLGASDTFTYRANVGQVLVLRNATAGALTPNIDGDGGTTVTVARIGAVDVSGGFTTASVAAGAVTAIPLDSIAEYLQGTIAVTGGDGMVATLLARA